MVFSPLDEELELVAGKLTPRGHERLVKYSSYMPFEQAVELFEDFMGIHVSKDVGQRYTEAAGAVYKVRRKWRSSKRSDPRAEACQANCRSARMGAWCHYYMGSGRK